MMEKSKQQQLEHNVSNRIKLATKVVESMDLQAMQEAAIQCIFDECKNEKVFRNYLIDHEEYLI